MSSSSPNRCLNIKVMLWKTFVENLVCSLLVTNEENFLQGSNVCASRY
ncbi:hypothetical protein SLEP1_g58100 [Rubroshorea leprosula]|uniref:Uncharacterized protein n=1 Tax=Rubroshorea leprosula TaxID=152421 RepID=A0AAV5MS91_9ROSI|nr:hypothetical protein SLEP1_g58100 [Rubroshorea leprosula]